MAASVRCLPLGRRLEDHLWGLEGRGRDRGPLGRRTTARRPTAPGGSVRSRGRTGHGGLRACEDSRRDGRARVRGCRGGGFRGRRGRVRCRAGFPGGWAGPGLTGPGVTGPGLGSTGATPGWPTASLGRRGLVVPGLPGRRRALGRRGAGRRVACRCLYLWRASAAAFLTVVLCIVQLVLEHPGYLPSSSRAQRTKPGPPLRAGAGRTRPLGGRRPYWPAPLRGALSQLVHLPCPGRAAAWPPQTGHWRPPGQVALAPAASPALVTTGRARPPGGVRPGCRQAVRQVSHAEQPFEVWHSRWLAYRRHTGRSPS